MEETAQEQKRYKSFRPTPFIHPESSLLTKIPQSQPNKPALILEDITEDYTPPATPGTRYLQSIIKLLKYDEKDPENPGFVTMSIAREACSDHPWNTLRLFENKRTLAYSFLRNPSTVCAALERYLKLYRPASCAWARELPYADSSDKIKVPDDILISHQYAATKSLGHIIPPSTSFTSQIFLAKFLLAATHKLDIPRPIYTRQIKRLRRSLRT